MRNLLQAKELDGMGGFIGVLALLGLLVIPKNVYSQCTVPGLYTNTTTATAGDLQFVMGTDRYNYDLGDPVEFWLSVYNSGPATVSIPNPYMISPLHEWSVLPDTCDSIYEPEGCRIDSPFYYPTGYYFFGIPLSVPPGECMSFTTSWSGIHLSSHLGRVVIPAVYTVTGGFTVGTAPTSQGVPLPHLEVQILITDVTPALPTTWSGIKTRVR